MDRLNQWLTLVANFGVVIGIVFLAYEIQQNNKLLTITAVESAIEGYIENNRIVLESADYASISRRGIEDVSQLNQDETFRFTIGLTNYFNHIFKIYRLYQEGLIPTKEWAYYAKDAAAFLSTEAGQALRKGNPELHLELFNVLTEVEPRKVSFTLD